MIKVAISVNLGLPENLICRVYLLSLNQVAARLNQWRNFIIARSNVHETAVEKASGH